MAGRPTRLRDERTHQAKPYEKRKTVLQTVTSAVRHFLTPSWLSDASCEPESSEAEERSELANGEREPAPFVPLAPQAPLMPSPAPSSPPRPTRDCAVGPDEGDETANGPPNFSVPVVPRPETPLQRTLERPLERPSLGRLSGQLSERLADQSLEQPSKRPASTPSPSSWMNAAAASSKRRKIWYENPLQSPFYSGQTTYGGAAAQNRLRMLATSQSSSVPIVARGAKSTGAAAGLSNTTRQILATLEKMATPISDAKRVPLKSRMPSSGTWSLPHRADPPTPTQGGPPVRSAARPALRTVVPARTETSRLEVSRVESIGSESSWMEALNKARGSRVETLRPEVPRVEAPKQDAPRTEPPSSAVEASGTLLPAAKPKPPVAPAREPPSSRKAIDRDAGGGKMVRVIHSAHAPPIKVGGPPAEPEEDLPTHVPLPPIQSLPSFSFNLKPQEPAPPPSSTGTVSGSTVGTTVQGSSATISTTVGSSGSNGSNGSIPTEPEFTFSKPLFLGTISTGAVGTQLEDDEEFQFSKPWGPHGEKEQQPEKKALLNDTVQGLAKAAEPAAKMDRPAQATSAETEGTKVKGGQKEETSKGNNDKKGSSITKGGDLWERFKPPAGSWSCSVCMVSNQASASRCLACESPRPATGVASTAASAPPPAPATAPPPPPPPPPASTASSSWECDACWVKNLPSAQRCVACETPRLSAAGSAPPAVTAGATAAAATTAATTTTAGAATASRWECDTCLVRNVPDAVRCIACETPRACGIGSSVPSAAATAAAAAFSFTVAASSSGPGAFGGVPFSTADTTTVKPFKFGVPTSGSAKPADAAASTESPAKSFSFGTTTEEAPKTFKFGSSTEQSSGMFKFGSSAEVPSKASKFGSATEESTKAFKFGSTTEESTTKAFKFGSTTEESTTKAFKFGSTTEESSAKPFKFGSTPEEPSAKAPKPGETAQEPAKMFTFGVSSGEPAKGLKLSSTVEGQAKSGDTDSSTEQPSKALKFSSVAEEAPKSSLQGAGPGDAAKPFSFGTSGGEPAKPFQLGTTTSAAEGAGNIVKLVSAASEPSKGFNFGPAVKEASKPFTFGSSSASELAAAFKFGSSMPDPTKLLALGSSEEQQTAKAAKLAAPPATEPAKLLQFGAPAGEAPKFGVTPAGEVPKFGAPSDAPAKPFSFGLPTTTVASAASKPFTFGIAEKPAAPQAPAATEQLQASGQGTSSGGLPGILSGTTPLGQAMAESSLAAPQTMEPPKPPAFPPTSQFVFGQKSDSGAGTFAFGTQGGAPPNFASPLGAAAPLPSFGTLTAKPLEQQQPPQAPQPTFGIGAVATAAPTFGALSAPKPAVTSAVAPAATSMQGGFGCQPTPSTGFGLPAAAPPAQPSFVFRPPAATTTPVTFQFGSTGPTTGGVFRFGAQPSQPSTPLQQPQQQQPTQEAFGAPFGQTAPMQFGMPPAPPFGMPDTENPFSATGSSAGPMQQRRIRKAIRRKPTPR